MGIALSHCRSSSVRTIKEQKTKWYAYLYCLYFAEKHNTVLTSTHTNTIIRASFTDQAWFVITSAYLSYFHTEANKGSEQSPPPLLPAKRKLTSNNATKTPHGFFKLHLVVSRSRNFRRERSAETPRPFSSKSSCQAGHEPYSEGGGMTAHISWCVSSDSTPRQ